MGRELHIIKVEDKMKRIPRSRILIKISAHYWDPRERRWGRYRNKIEELPVEVQAGDERLVAGKLVAACKETVLNAIIEDELIL